MKRKKSLKGFTLVELIIVLAIFSVIMVVVMNFIEPVSRLMNKTSTREKTAAYVDNIDEYVDKSIRYASFVQIFPGDFCDVVDRDNIISEDEAVKNFVNAYYDGAVDSADNPVTGTVHVLKLLNEPDKMLPALSPLPKEGQILEDTYSFTAGDSKPIKIVDTSVTPPAESISREFTSGFPSASVTPVSMNQEVINPEHFVDYSYYYELGFREFIPVSERTVTPGNFNTLSKAYNENLITDTSGNANMYAAASGAIPIDIPGQDDFYYSELIPMRDSGNNLMVIGQNNFAVSMVAYRNDSKGNCKINCTKTLTDSTTVSTSIFRSPSYLATSSMALQNIVPSLSVNPTCVMHDQEFDTGAPLPDMKQVTIWVSPFWLNRNQFSASYTSSSNIYFIYVVPSEVNS